MSVWSARSTTFPPRSPWRIIPSSATCRATTKRPGRTATAISARPASPAASACPRPPLELELPGPGRIRPSTARPGRSSLRTVLSAVPRSPCPLMRFASTPIRPSDPPWSSRRGFRATPARPHRPGPRKDPGGRYAIDPTTGAITTAAPLIPGMIDVLELNISQSGYHFWQTYGGATYYDHPTDGSFIHSIYIVVSGDVPPTHNITTTAGAGGTITPGGVVVLNEGDSQTFTITPNATYVITDVLVDGVSVGPVYNYTFSDVTADHTISATFELPPYYTITASDWRRRHDHPQRPDRRRSRRIAGLCHCSRSWLRNRSHHRRRCRQDDHQHLHVFERQHKPHDRSDIQAPSPTQSKPQPAPAARSGPRVQ